MTPNIDTINQKLDNLQEDVTFIKSKIDLVDKHEKVLYGKPEEAAEGKCGLINQVSGQGRKLDKVQSYIGRAGMLINIAVTAFITGLVNLALHRRN